MKDQKTQRYATGAPLDSLPADHAANLLGHELGNVLNGLLGMAGLLRDSGLDLEQERWLEAIEESGRQMLRLIESTATFVQESPAATERSTARMDGLEMLEQVVCCHFPASVERSNRLLLVIEPALDRFWKADSRLLRQVLDNLLDNANKHTRNGDVILEARSSGRDTLVLEVCDNGRGMDRGLGQRLFEPYRRGANGDGRGCDGLGLGLYVCRQISAGLGGRIDPVARAERGACLRITLPGLLGSDSARLAHPSLFARLDCRLALDHALRRSVGGFLSRLGIDWADAGQPPRAPPHPGVLIRGIEPGGGLAAPCLELSSRVAGADHRRRLGAPLLPSRLAPLLLELALEGFSFGDRRGSALPRHRSGQPGARDRRPE
ncbi:MAG: HAMP domain-containing histidine kinase [Gammaproteobacteria bacterium]|nr:HAMP domain-containing histidine kinase [Gammaproteobacteria bacterium]